VPKTKRFNSLAAPTSHRRALKDKDNFGRCTHLNGMIVERDDGWFQLGTGDDAAGPFPSPARQIGGRAELVPGG
jgi:hypothetical protein